MTMWASKIEDNSMDWVIKTGDVVFYTDEQRPENGDVCMVVIRKGEQFSYSLKRVYFLNENEVLLQPDNFLQFPPETMALDEIYAVRPLVRPIPKHTPPRPCISISS